MGRDPPPASGGRGTEEGDRTAAAVGRQDGAPRRGPADAASAVSPPRVSSLDPWRDQITQWLRDDREVDREADPAVAAAAAGAVSPRTVRRYVAALRRRVTSKEAFVHRSVASGTTMEVDFGESWVDIAGTPRKVKYLVATLPCVVLSWLLKAKEQHARARERTMCAALRLAASSPRLRVTAWDPGDQLERRRLSLPEREPVLASCQARRASSTCVIRTGLYSECWTARLTWRRVGSVPS